MRPFTFTSFLATAVMLLCAISPTNASIQVQVSAGGWGPQTFQLNSNFPGDTITASASGTPTPFLVTVPTVTPVLLQMGNFYVDYSADNGSAIQSGDFPFSLTRDVTVDGVVHSVAQNALLQVRPDADTLILSDSLPTNYSLPDITVTLTALGVTLRADTLYNHFFAINSVFAVSEQNALVGTEPVPEAASLAIWSLFGGLGIGLAWWRKSCTVG